MPKIKASTNSPTKLVWVDGVEYLKSDLRIFYKDQVKDDSGNLDTTVLRIGLEKNKGSHSEPVVPASLITQWQNGSDVPYATLDALLADLATLVGFSLGDGSSSGITITQQVANYSALSPGTVIGDLAYVENAQGTSWLPGTIGGTYYPNGFYLWDGTNWISDRNAIANQLEQLIIGASGKVNTSDVVNDLNQVTAGKVLDARQGKALADLIAAKWTAVDATDAVKGIMKLYPEVGDNTDGAITQKAVTDVLDAKVNLNNWVDHSSLSTISGFSALSTVVIRYIPIGKTFMYYFFISGASNSPNFTFTIHTNHLGSTYFTGGGLNRNGGNLSNNPPRITVTSNSATISVLNTLAGSTWSGAGTKEASGWFIVESN